MSLNTDAWEAETGLIRVRMLRERYWQDMGREVRLEVDAVHDLPRVVAQALIATSGAAVRVQPAEADHA